MNMLVYLIGVGSASADARYDPKSRWPAQLGWTVSVANIPGFSTPLTIVLHRSMTRMHTP